MDTSATFPLLLAKQRPSTAVGVSGRPGTAESYLHNTKHASQESCSHWFIHSWKVEEETQPSSQQKHRESTLNKWSILCIPCTCILCSQQYYFLTFSWIKPPHFFFSFLRIFILLYFVAVLLPLYAQILLALAVLCTMLCYTENYLTSHIFLISQWKNILATRK